ncbi:MAG: nicotinate-nucleotide adenylyltransferase [Prevotellaceae bacterium]|nr:nicotinate-nucleotide adenylyltransferase [Prevotellaceae bacterium]
MLENAEKEIVGKINDFLLPCQQPETIGLYFGSFNPIHNGHLKLAKYITANRIADEVWFVVSPCNPLKQQDELLDETLRMEMVKLATETEDTLKVCDVELSLPTPSYTIDTLNVLKKQYPNNNFVLLIGSDNALAFDRWKNYKEILNEYKIMVYPRLNYDFAEILQKFPQMQILDTPFYDISASKIREKIKKQDLEITKQWLQEPVSAFIEENKLYQ